MILNIFITILITTVIIFIINYSLYKSNKIDYNNMIININYSYIGILLYSIIKYKYI